MSSNRANLDALTGPRALAAFWLLPSIIAAGLVNILFGLALFLSLVLFMLGLLATKALTRPSWAEAPGLPLRSNAECRS